MSDGVFNRRDFLSAVGVGAGLLAVGGCAGLQRRSVCKVVQGKNVGRKRPAEMKEFRDPQTNVRVRQLTDYRGNSHHLYFTNPGWYDNDRRLVFSSDRDNMTNLFSIELGTGEITQLTDLEPNEVAFFSACLNPRKPEVYYSYGGKLIALDLWSLRGRVIYEVPKGFVSSMANCTADGRYLCAGIYEDLSDRFKIDIARGYVGFREISAARPLSRIERIAVDGSGFDTVHEENYWINHVNTSPTQSDIITFCHEGPWDMVDNRIWGLNIETGEVWKIRPRENEGEKVGHEYWFADGQFIGYHGSNPDRTAFLGYIRYDNSERVEVSFPYQASTGHIHSNDRSLIVGDNGDVVRLWRYNGSVYDKSRVLCQHKSTKHIQQFHVHPRFSPDGREILFTTNMSGYGNVYLADVPDDVESLPIADN